MDLTKEITFLLYKHNCVIIPHFGAFIVHDKPAELNTELNYASPKNRIISFNNQILNNDGLLANHIQTIEKCSYEEGLLHIHSFVDHLKEELQAKNNFNFDQLGTFYNTKEEKLIFVPNQMSNFSMDAFGLPKLKLKKYKHEDPIPTIARKPDSIVKASHTIPSQDIRRESKLKQRNEKVQDQKLETHSTQKRRKQSLRMVNIVGSFFLVTVILSLINFELNNPSNIEFDYQIASVIDSTPSIESTIEHFSINVKTPHQIFAEVSNQVEANELRDRLISKYKQAETVEGKDGTFKVFIISFSDQELAKEYKTLLQNRMNQKLTLQ